MTSTTSPLGGGARGWVLDLEADDLRAARPLDDLGADTTAVRARRPRDASAGAAP